LSLFQAFARFKQSYIERRQSLRENVQFPAWIDVGDGSQLCSCSVVDVSEGGARIVTPYSAEVPKEFWLVFSKDRTRRRYCRRAWRSTTEIGVEYLGPLQSDFFPPTLN
jgi:PilZ domain